MKKYYFLLLPIFFTACMDSAKPIALDEKFKPYGSIEKSCLKILNDETPHCEEEHCDILPSECKEFIRVLTGANEAYKLMQENKDNAAFYAAKEKSKKEKKRLKIQHKHLNLVIKNQALDAIDQDDLKQFSELVHFSYHPMNLTYYKYMRKNMPHFQGTKKYYHFEKKYALKNYKKGYALVNKGQYTKGLALLEHSADMKNEKAAKLCGDTFSYIYPSKAKKCYHMGVALGNKHMQLNLARAYEQEKNTKEALFWYKKSAASGNFISKYKLYSLDKTNVIELKGSADTGYDQAQYAYGMHLYDKKEYEGAIKYLLLAADQAYTPAYYPLGKLYFSKKSYAKAYAYLIKGSANADSMYKLAYLKEKGKGTNKNYYTASTYYKKSKKLGRAGVQKDINRMVSAQKRLKRSQVKRQKALAEQSYANINAKARLREKVALEDRRICDQQNAQKAESKALKVQACGNEPSKSLLRKRGARIHLQGTLTHWLGKTAFIVKVGGQEYYVKDEDDNARLNKGDSVNMLATSTGHREIIHGLSRSIFEEADEAAIEKAYALNYESVCPY